ncbi:MAG TPA: phosphodiester glycosidase family protein [Xanthobacteraceae bacterium]|nr:phosphodiester glycosidase family protein [Xanthobacteraceae bacterium]
MRAETGAPCRAENYENRGFVVCEFDLKHYDLKLFWKNSNGEAYGSLQNIPHSNQPNGAPLVFATNGGMYRPDRSPVGLYIENGRTLQNAITGSGTGNFYLKPNGIFFASGESAGILETGRFLHEHLHADNATQSGPMLVINGRLHPRFSLTSLSEKIRNGVGITGEKKVVFAISDDPVTFTVFAKFFRDQLHCPDALYLDGSISSIYAPSVHRADYLWPLGPIIAVYAHGQP